MLQPKVIMPFMVRLCLAVLFVTLGLAMITSRPAYAASIVVNNASDTTGTCSTTGTGTCTLRDAITYANSNPGADTITFSISNATIFLAADLTPVTGDLTIDGTTQNITVDGQDTRSILQTNQAITLNVNALTFYRGDGGPTGGGALFLGNALAVANVTNSTFRSNTSTSLGGAVNSRGTLNIANSTFSGNTGLLGGAIYAESGATVTVTNSTLSGNTSTLNSAGGIYSTGAGTTVTLSNTIVADSTGSDCTTNDGGAITADAYNIDSDGSCDSATQKTSAQIALGALASNGGPTWTMALGAGSAAIDTGDDAVCAAAPVNGLDQRGVTRPQGAHCDVGAYEAVASCPTFPVSVANEGELNTAIACYNAETVAGTYTINVTQNISLTASTTAINNATSGVSLVINGGGFTVDGQGTAGVRPFEVAASTTVTMNQITITGGNVPGDNTTGVGGGIRNYGTLTLNESTVQANTSGFSGGGISNHGTLTVNRSTIAGNTTDSEGGGLINHSASTATLNNSTVSGNSTISSSSGGGGGGVYNVGTITIDSTTIANNAVAAGSGGGIHNANFGTVQMSNSIVANNTGAADCDSPLIPLNNVDHSLIESTARGCNNASGVNGNITGQDPVLGALANNGGTTQTHALLPGSPAIDAGDTTLTVDQRGVARPQGTADDMGAVEVKALNGPGGSVVQVSATTSNNPTPQPCAATGTNLAIYTITQTLRNQSANSYTDLFFRVKTLEYTTPQGGAVPSLCNATTVVNNGGVGSILAIPNASLPGGNSQFDPNENLVQVFQIGRPVAAQFRLKVDLFSSTAVSAGSGQANEIYLGTIEYEVDANGQIIGQHALFLPLVVR